MTIRSVTTGVIGVAFIQALILGIGLMFAGNGSFNCGHYVSGNSSTTCRSCYFTRHCLHVVW